MAIDLPESSPEHIISVVDLVVMRPGADAVTCAGFVDISEDHARRALDSAVLLKLVEANSGGYFPSALTTDLLARGSLEQKRQIFRTHLERFEPFAYVRSRLMQGFEFHQACREARTLYGLTPTPAVIRDVFSRWGAYARTLVGDPPEVAQSHGIDSPIASVIDAILDEHASAEVALSDQLGPQVFIALNQSVRDNLLLAVQRLRHLEEPRSVAQPIGIAFEDFLRVIAGQYGIDVSKQTGIVQVANILRGESKVTKKHLGIIQTIGAIRTAVEHGIDQDENKEWSISSPGVALLLSTVILAIKSVTAYNGHGGLEL